jgi:hypothetical protein
MRKRDREFVCSNCLLVLDSEQYLITGRDSRRGERERVRD